jgi:putative DNA primase/helicase
VSADRIDFEDMPDPDVAELDVARARVADLPERAAADVSVAFAPDVVAACVVLRNQSLPEFIALERKLHAIKDFPRGQFRDAVRAAGKASAGESAAAPGGTTEPSGSRAWRSKLTYSNGKPEPTESNCVTALVHAPEWKGVLAFNEFANNVVARKAPPWHRDDAPVGGGKPGEWEDGDDVRLVCWFQRTAGLRVSVATALNALVIVARRTTYHPVREYLNGLAWDGIQRLPTWLATYAGSTQPEAYLARVGSWFLVSAVARIYEPGCKADHCIILEGKQGRGKSTLVQRLVPQPEWFAEHNANLMDKDAYAILNGRWILELAELDSLARAEVGRIKRYMTTAVDAYRPVWARRVARFPRHGVFIGTVNDSDYLRDPTGNRRFWPVAVERIDNDGLARDRDQLWAEAVHHYRNQARWWPHPDDESLLEEQQEERYRPDVWEEPIARWLAARMEEEGKKPAVLRDVSVTVTQVLEHAIGKNRKDQEDRDSIRVGRIMTRLGWDRRRTRSGNEDAEDRDSAGKHRRVYAYYPPVAPTPTGEG